MVWDVVRDAILGLWQNACILYTKTKARRKRNLYMAYLAPYCNLGARKTKVYQNAKYK